MSRADHECMTFILFLTAVLVAGPLAVLTGESRYDDRDRRGWFPGARRP
jgi:hypothetical protein